MRLGLFQEATQLRGEAGTDVEAKAQEIGEERSEPELSSGWRRMETISQFQIAKSTERRWRWKGVLRWTQFQGVLVPEQEEAAETEVSCAAPESLTGLAEMVK